MDADAALRLDRQLCFALYRAERAMVQAYRPLLEGLGVTYPQYLVLLVLWERDGLTVKELGERLHLDSGTLTPLLRRMEGHGLLTRARRADDERQVEISLTSQGRRLKQRALRVPAALFDKCGLATTELARLRDELQALAARLGDAGSATQESETHGKEGST
ncbi:Organic hydroperoxide resistance transcriptional regulator [Minicystis rosea]|nr:Organic hydroperoxide resistance transcriptional regulator [Minicystis rosea]